VTARSQTLSPDDFCIVRNCEFLAEGEYVPGIERAVPADHLARVQGATLSMRLQMCEAHRLSNKDIERTGRVWEQWVPAPATMRRLRRMAEGAYGGR
jgi:hypothetical protein